VRDIGCRVEGTKYVQGLGLCPRVGLQIEDIAVRPATLGFKDFFIKLQSGPRPGG
jgi:hypothetical protein